MNYSLSSKDQLRIYQKEDDKNSVIISVISGSCILNGIILPENHQRELFHCKLSLFSLNDCVIQIITESKSIQIYKMDVFKDLELFWPFAHNIVNSKSRVSCLVLGAQNTGKHTIANMLANLKSSYGHVNLTDTDFEYNRFGVNGCIYSGLITNISTKLIEPFNSWRFNTCRLTNSQLLNNIPILYTDPTGLISKEFINKQFYKHINNIDNSMDSIVVLGNCMLESLCPNLQGLDEFIRKICSILNITHIVCTSDLMYQCIPQTSGLYIYKTSLWPGAVQDSESFKRSRNNYFLSYAREEYKYIPFPWSSRICYETIKISFSDISWSCEPRIDEQIKRKQFLQNVLPIGSNDNKTNDIILDLPTQINSIEELQRLGYKKGIASNPEFLISQIVEIIGISVTDKTVDIIFHGSKSPFQNVFLF
jgi:hypothetical protein